MIGWGILLIGAGIFAWGVSRILVAFGHHRQPESNQLRMSQCQVKRRDGSWVEVEWT